MSEFSVDHLLKTASLTIRDVNCHGTCRQMTPEECASDTQLVFPYRGVYLLHLGQDQGVQEANQVLFFNAGEAYRVSHPVAGGDGSLTVLIAEELLRELAPAESIRDKATISFRQQRLRIDARTQVLVA